jgi:hypothetical protein
MTQDSWDLTRRHLLRPSVSPRGHCGLDTCSSVLCSPFRAHDHCTWTPAMLGSAGCSAPKGGTRIFGLTFVSSGPASTTSWRWPLDTCRMHIWKKKSFKYMNCETLNVHWEEGCVSGYYSITTINYYYYYYKFVSNRETCMMKVTA